MRRTVTFDRSHRRAGARRGPAGEAGFSLLEGLFSAAILLFLAVGMLPLFTTASIANADGHDSSVASFEARSWIDTLFARSVDDPAFDLVAPLPGYTVRAIAGGGGGQEMVMPAEVWDTAATTPDHARPRLGDAGWVASPTGSGLVLWRREGLVRDYAYADIASGVIDTETGSTITTLGHPDLFDAPLAVDQPPSLRQFKENDLRLVSQRGGGEDLGIGRLRTRFFRTY